MNEFANYQKPTVTILLADGFDENWLNRFLVQSDLNGWDYHFVGLTDAPVQGDHGNFRSIHFTLSRLEGIVPQLLLVPEGETCLKHLFVDPHVHVLIQNTLSGTGRVALSRVAELYMRRAHVHISMHHDKLVFQRNASISTFAQQILH